MIEAEIEKYFIENKDGIFSFMFDNDFIAFKGHFPNYPILPGIVQIEMALFCIKKLLNNDSLQLKEVSKIKFIKPIFPNVKLFLSIVQNEDKFNITVKSSDETFSQIHIKAQ
ncbi:MAG: hypothetical protein LBV66_01340 [Elusimicrobiota bacterium]|jgi:3-hydroxyacyl-[acyl-carrier-protein] dehydratase|nr:hypothetical protein [Elusimicrobiota bacterium]